MSYNDINIDWCGEILSELGYGLQARRMLKPLIDGGANIKLIPNEGYVSNDRKITDPYWVSKVEESKNKPDAPIRINFSLPNLYQLGKGINIGYSMWETSNFPREWLPHINRVDHFAVPSNYLVKAAKELGVSSPIHIIKPTINTSAWSPNGDKVIISEVPENHVKFLFVGNWIPRKNFEDLIIGYLCAFDKITDVTLIIKTWSTQPGPDGRKHIEDAIRHISSRVTGIDKPKISLLTDVLSEGTMQGLYRFCDGFVSVTHGEDACQALLEAMSSGLLVVSNTFGSIGSCIGSINSLVVESSEMPVNNATIPLYDSYQNWSRIDMKSYISKLKKAYALIKSNNEKHIKERARKYIEDNYSEQVNTLQIANLIRKINEKKEKQSTKILIDELVGLPPT